MIRFLLKGILRDRSRSLLPIVVVAIGVALTIILSGYINGAMGDVADQNARFDTGHVKVTTRAYAAEIKQLPNDLALLEVDRLKNELRSRYPGVTWTERIRSGGLLDVPDARGESRGQGPVSVTAIRLLDESSGEVERMSLGQSLAKGKLPTAANEALIGDVFAGKLGVEPGDQITFMGTTMNGSMTFQNFRVSGTLRFGNPALDRGAMIFDLAAAQQMLDMEDGTGELLGFFPDGLYDDDRARAMSADFNDSLAADDDEFAPSMMALSEQNGLGEYLAMAEGMSGLMIFVFVLAMSVVLWNTGLLGGLRRYREFGVRLAMGEPKGRIYRSQLLEALLVGIIGSTIGLLLGLGLTYYLQVVGIDIGRYIQDASMMMPSVLRARLTPSLLWIGFIPGILAMLIGTALSGLGIYRRDTARLMKEMEV